MDCRMRVVSGSLLSTITEPFTAASSRRAAATSWTGSPAARSSKVNCSGIGARLVRRQVHPARRRLAHLVVLGVRHDADDLVGRAVRREAPTERVALGEVVGGHGRVDEGHRRRARVVALGDVAARDQPGADRLDVARAHPVVVDGGVLGRAGREAHHLRRPVADSVPLKIPFSEKLAAATPGRARRRSSWARASWPAARPRGPSARRPPSRSAAGRAPARDPRRRAPACCAPACRCPPAA